MPHMKNPAGASGGAFETVHACRLNTSKGNLPRRESVLRIDRGEGLTGTFGLKAELRDLSINAELTLLTRN
jgi:hypothetical protein